MRIRSKESERHLKNVIFAVTDQFKRYVGKEDEFI
jgi:hypothetical protein